MYTVKYFWYDEIRFFWLFCRIVVESLVSIARIISFCECASFFFSFLSNIHKVESWQIYKENIVFVSLCTSLCTYVNYFFFFSDISSLCRTQIFTVQNLLAGLGPAFSSSGEYRLSKGFYCPFHGLCVGLVRSGVFGHLHCLPGLFHDYQRRVGRLQRHWRYQGNFCHETTGWPISFWRIFWGCFEVTGWLKIKIFNSSEKFMQISTFKNW